MEVYVFVDERDVNTREQSAPITDKGRHTTVPDNLVADVYARVSYDRNCNHSEAVGYYCSLHTVPLSLASCISNAGPVTRTLDLDGRISRRPAQCLGAMIFISSD